MSVYFLRRGKHVKVGTTNNVARRILELQTGNAEILQLLAIIPGGVFMEGAIHDLLQPHHVHGEWFKYHGPVRQFINLIAGAAHSAGLEDLVSWWELATGPHAIAAAKAVLADPESDHEQRRAAHITVRDLT